MYPKRFYQLLMFGLVLAVFLSPAVAVALTCTCAHPDDAMDADNCPRGTGDQMCNGTPTTCVGTNKKDKITGSRGDDVISGRGGKDTIHGGEGHDLICGDRGADKLYGDAGDDDLRGGKGEDKLRGGAGDDELRGNKGRDNLLDTEGNNTCIGGGKGNKVKCISEGGGGPDPSACPCFDGQELLDIYAAWLNQPFDDLRECEVFEIPNVGIHDRTHFFC